LCLNKISGLLHCVCCVLLGGAKRINKAAGFVLRLNCLILSVLALTSPLLHVGFWALEPSLPPLSSWLFLGHACDACNRAWGLVLDRV
jgi:hypothetical protein